MSSVSPAVDLPALSRQLEGVTADVRREFTNLSAAQLNWKQSAEEWSIGQCLDHLVQTNEQFFLSFDQIIRGEKQQTVWERLPVLPKFFGRFIVNAANPESTRKVKAPKVFAPASSDVDAHIVESFIAHQALVASKLKALEKVDARNIKVTSPVARFVTYSLLDACTILVYHERRHFEQARRVLAASGFPREVH
ncbi:MAG: DinB family protein [Acidobacteria bacterium]|nr:DinB family protein [Acidobacteriota bacterium]